MVNQLKRLGKVIVISLMLMLSFSICTMADEQGTNNTVDKPDDTTINTQGPQIRILFIGNSATYYNDMPQMLNGLATADGHNVYIEAITAPAHKLYQFADTQDTYGAKAYFSLTNYKWDYVIIQDYREVIITDIAKSVTAAGVLSTYIKNAGAQMIVYSTQADYAGRNFTKDGFNLYLSNNEMQHYMLKGYFTIANKYNAKLAPSGMNFERCMEQCPEINLYNSDNIHPTPEGSYLAACTIYGTIFETSPLGNKYLAGSKYDTNNLLKKVSNEEAAKLQALADPRLVMDTSYVEVKKGYSSKVSALFTASEDNELLKDYTNDIQYSSTNDTVLSVNKKTGVYNAVSVGESMIMATTDSGLISMCTVNVKQEATSFAINETGTAILYKGDTIQYTTSIAPSDTTDEITWKSNKTDIVTVDENGLVTAKKVGVAKITATTTSGLKDVRYIRVKLKTPENVKVKQLSTKAKNKKCANISITWKKVSSATKYYVFRSSGSGYKKIATTTKRKYIDKNRKKGVQYKYKIRAVYSVLRCNSYKSNAVTIKVK